MEVFGPSTPRYSGNCKGFLESLQPESVETRPDLFHAPRGERLLAQRNADLIARGHIY